MLILWILSPFQPERPYLNFNDKEMVSCELSVPPMTIRLYQGSVHYAVSAQARGAVEKQFLYSVDGSNVGTLSCSGSGVTLYSSVKEESSMDFTAMEIERLQDYPVVYYRGELSHPGGNVFPDTRHYVVGAILAIVGWILSRGYGPGRRVSSHFFRALVEIAGGSPFWGPLLAFVNSGSLNVG